MTSRDTFEIEFEIAAHSVGEIESGGAPNRGTVRITTAEGTEEVFLELFTYSVDQFLDAVSALLRGGRGGVSTEDVMYLVLERDEQRRGRVTCCVGEDAIENPERRVVPPEKRPIDATVPLPVLVDAVVAAVADLVERIEEINEDVRERRWFRDLQAKLDDVRELADEP